MKFKGLIIMLLASLGPSAVYAQAGAGAYRLTYTVAAIQGKDRGIMEMTGTVTINSDSHVSLRQGAPYLTKNLGGKGLFRTVIEQDLEFRKDGEGHWVVAKGAGTTRQFAGIINLIICLDGIRTTGAPPDPRPMARDWNLVEQTHPAWRRYDSEGERSQGIFMLRGSPGNGVVQRATNGSLQGVMVGSIGEFDWLTTLVANGPVDRGMLEKVITHRETDLLQIVLVTLTRE